MFRKVYFTVILACAFFATGAVSSYAQFAPVSGVVELVNADGKRTPVAGALVEPIRIDIKASLPSAKTNKKGEFSFAGLPFGATFVLSASAPGCAPGMLSNVKAGQEKLLISLTPGDGRKYTEDEVRKGSAATSAKGGGEQPAELTAEQKKAMADYEKQKAAIEAKNKNIQAGDELARKSNEEGNALLKAENWDAAAAKFQEGVTAVPDYVGSTPILLNGKMLALKGKGYSIYREGAATADAEARRAKYVDANKYYDDALAAFQQALDVINKAEATQDPAEQKRRELLKVGLYSAASEIHRLKAVPSVDTSKGAEANTVLAQYIAIEPDPAKKLSAQLILGDINRSTGDFEKAVAAYRSVLEIKPDHPEAMAGLGLSLFAQAVMTDPPDKAKQQEGLNYMQKYTEIAPIAATDPQNIKEFKQSVKDTVDYLKAQKMAPQKITTAPPKKKP
jgi:tetratricopeptide (TPR) repeat protein